MALALATGIFYFTWVVTGLSVSLGLSVTIIGIPLLILFFGSVRVLSLVEGRLVEVMLGERMPRRPLYTVRGCRLWQRIGDMFTDARTWSTMLYMLLMLPLGIAYFTLVVTLLTTSLFSIAAPVLVWLGVAEAGVSVNGWQVLDYDGDVLATSVPAPRLPLPLGIAYFTLVVTLLTTSLFSIAAPVLVWLGVAEAGVSVNGWQVLDYDGDVLATSVPAPGLPLLLVAGVLLLFATMHIARGIG